MTKRCKNCGWINDDSSIRCQKCNTLLSDNNVAATQRPSSQPLSSEGNEGLRRTVLENNGFNTEQNHRETPKMRVSQCFQCGYPIREGMNVCPNCGTPIGPKVKDEDCIDGKRCLNCNTINPEEAKFCYHCGAELNVINEISVTVEPSDEKTHFATVNPWMKPKEGVFCTLKPIAWEGENVTHQPLSFSGKSIILNRDNTDPNNHSITSTEQAVLTFEDGEWYIVDKSALKTTYVQASHSTKLNKGDIIILGNRLFEFNF